MCVCTITCTSQHHSHALLLSETGVAKVKYLDGMQRGHVGGGQRLKVGHETGSEGGVDKLEKIFTGIPQSNNSDLFLRPYLQKWSRHLFFVWNIIFCFCKTESSFVSPWPAPWILYLMLLCKRMKKIPVS